MKSLSAFRILYGFAALYDGLLGLAFIVAGPRIYEFAGITPPNHWGYVHFAAGVLAIFGLMFLQIAREPVQNRGLIVYGILLKVCYVATIVWHSLNGGLPRLWQWFAVADTVFIVVFFWSMTTLELIPSSEDEAGRSKAT